MRECWRQRNWIQTFFGKGGWALGGVLEAKKIGLTFCAMREGGHSEGVLAAKELDSNLFLYREGGL